MSTKQKPSLFSSFYRCPVGPQTAADRESCTPSSSKRHRRLHFVILVAIFKGRDEVAHFPEFEYSLNLFPLSGGDWPEAFAHGDLRSHVFNALFRQMVPPPLRSAFQHALHRCGRGRFSGIFPWIGQRALIILPSFVPA